MAAALACAAAAPASAAPLTLPFDFSRHAIGLQVTVKGMPLYALLDTGVNPSVIDSGRAKALRLPLDRRAVGRGSGEGGGTTEAIPSRIEQLEIGGRRLGDVEALSADLSAISKTYGRPVGAVLGYSFLKDKIVLLDYPRTTLTIFDSAREATAENRQCRRRISIPFTSFGGEQFPVMHDFRFGHTAAPVTLDTGSNRILALYQSALQLPAVRAALKTTGAGGGSSFGGSYTTRTATLNLPLRIGPFALTAGQTVSVVPVPESLRTRVANAGNGMFAALKVRLLLDYAGKRISLYGQCR
jgi:hypothetical protein